MNPKTFVLTALALTIWGLVGLRYLNLAADPVAASVSARAEPPGAAAPLRRAFTVPTGDLYPDPFYPTGGSPGNAEEPSPERDAPEQDAYASGFPQGFGVPSLPFTVQGVVGTSALVVLPTGQTLLVQEGDVIRTQGFAEARVVKVYYSGITLEVDRETIDVPFQN